MGHSGNWLAWLLAHTHWFKALVQKNWWHSAIATTKKIITNVWLSWRCQPLPSHVASMCTHLSTSLQQVLEENFCWTHDMDLAFKCMKALMGMIASLLTLTTINPSIHIHTDHLNITTNNTTPDCIICWLNYIEQFNPCIHFIPSKDNGIADTLSWLDRLEEYVLSKEKQVFVLKDLVSKGMDFADDPLLIKCFLHLPPLAVQDTNPTDYQWIFENKLTLTSMY